jgi:hypothetical protein
VGADAPQFLTVEDISAGLGAAANIFAARTPDIAAADNVRSCPAISLVSLFKSRR